MTQSETKIARNPKEQWGKENERRNKKGEEKTIYLDRTDFFGQYLNSYSGLLNLVSLGNIVAFAKKLDIFGRERCSSLRVRDDVVKG